MHRGRLALVPAVALTASLLTGSATGVTKPGRTINEPARVVAISVTGRGFTYAVADNATKTDCAHAVLVSTSARTARWRLAGKPTNEPCSQGLSTGDGISAVAMSANRSLWIQYAGGNNRDWQLFTASRTRTKPRQLAFVEQDVDLDAPIVVGQGTLRAVPYAVKDKLTYLGDNGAAVFKWTAPSTVKLLASGDGPGSAEVAAFLFDGTLALLSGTGQVVKTYTLGPEAISALFLAPAGVVTQSGSTVSIRDGAKTTTATLPARAQMFGYGQGRVFYEAAGAIRALKVSDGTDSLLVAAGPGKTMPASYATAGGFAWATGNQIKWDCASCVTY